MHVVSFMYLNLSLNCFPFSSFQGKLFLSPRIMTFFHCYHCQRFSFPLNLSISISPTSVTNCSDICNNQKFNTKPLSFHHLAGGRVPAVHREASPNENAKRTAIHHQLILPRGRLAKGSVPQMLQYIYAPPPPKKKLPQIRRC